MLPKSATCIYLTLGEVGFSLLCCDTCAYSPHRDFPRMWLASVSLPDLTFSWFRDSMYVVWPMETTNPVRKAFDRTLTEIEAQHAGR